ncbi:fibulin-2-like [Gouania willdenowi]|nr:fibulin-2-like [Gouania willdenowi]
MSIQRATLLLCLLMQSLDTCLSQNDCTGVDCPDVQNCIQTVLENGACCPTCTQRGCTCEGYQYYDCIQAGFRKGKVPEGESYFVDFGSTECSCPQGGGKISCHFIPCPDIPPNCIDILQPADGCLQCGRIGCTHGNKKYEAGNSFQINQCQVCHCPNEGGKLMCSPIPGCDPSVKNKPLTSTEINNSPLRNTGSSRDSRRTSPEKEFSKLALGNTLPLYKQDTPTFGTEEYEYNIPRPTSSIQNLAQPLASSTTPLAEADSNSMTVNSNDDKLRADPRSVNSERSGEETITHFTNVATSNSQSKTSKPSPTTTATQRVSTEDHRPHGETGETHTRDRDTAAQETLKVKKSSGQHRHSSHSRNHSLSHTANHKERERMPIDERWMHEKLDSHLKVQPGPTKRDQVGMNEEGAEPQPLHHNQPHNGKRATEVSAKEMVETCCETGGKWASTNGHCNNMELPTKDRHSMCWTAQQQCCLSSLRESRCSAGINAAKAGSLCAEDSSNNCNTDSYKECCGCCSLGLHFRREGHRCEAHQSLGFHCSHIFLNCCEGEERWTGRVKERPALEPSPPPQKVTDSLYPKEAFSIGEERDGQNAFEVEDMDECAIYEGNICHHRCVNTLGSFRCECFPGYVLQEDAFTCAQETLGEDNRLKEVNGAELDPTALLPTPTKPPVPLDPCEGNICEQQCAPVGGRPQCSCFPGLSLRADGRSCEDVNECLLSAHTCQLDERCVNTVGSYVCQRLITCPPGYHINNDICEDINECVQGSHNCGADFECVNTEGSFRCNPKPRCPAGFHRDSQGNCNDLDECGALTQPCSPGFNCINTVGSFMCQRKIMCSRGYHANPEGSRCIDVDECQSSLHRCGDGQICHNLPGSYRCECQPGYQFDSFSRMCMDVNECWRYPGRLCPQTCENTPGSYQCSCTTGFSLSSDGKNCEDVNECVANPCSQECANIYGSYQCYCRQGYYLREDGHSCEDIDECTQSVGHLCTYKCVNVPGSYQCACPEYGYTMSPNGRSCIDIDECITRAHNCTLDETCYNIQGGHRCLALTCPPNYRKVSDTRCERMTCPTSLECQNSPLRITYYYLSFQSNIVIPAQIFRIGPSPAYSGDNVIVTITQGNEENYFSTRKLNAYTGAVYLHRQVDGQRDFFIHVEMKLWRQGTFTTFQARIYVFITGSLL